MDKDLSHYRKNYKKKTLTEEVLPDNPMVLFKQWFEEAEHYFKIIEPNAMTLATIDKNSCPVSRVVLLKKFTSKGFVFYTNYNSDKGRAISANPKVCVSFFWKEAERQIIIKGEAAKITETDSDNYFSSRPRGSQLSVYTSNQSEVIKSRSVLEERVKRLEIEFKGKPIPRPKHWGGYHIKPYTIEFWQGRPNRLHDRIRFTLENGNSWSKIRLSP